MKEAVEGWQRENKELQAALGQANRVIAQQMKAMAELGASNEVRLMYAFRN